MQILSIGSVELREIMKHEQEKSAGENPWSSD